MGWDGLGWCENGVHCCDCVRVDQTGISLSRMVWDRLE